MKRMLMAYPGLCLLIWTCCIVRATAVLTKEYDYIVVGSGAAGSVVGGRLSEISKDVSVLILEAGKRPAPLSEVPAEAVAMVHTGQDWGYLSEPQTHACQGLADKQTRLATGKAIGGGTAINFMLYVRGNERDYDCWEASGATGWSYENVLPYFKKAERAIFEGLNQTSPFRGWSGPMPLTYSLEDNPLHQAYLSASHDVLDIPYGDYNAGRQLSVSSPQTTRFDGRRITAADAYISLNQCERNVQLVMEATAEKVIIDESKTARGVVVSYNGAQFNVTAKREVILAAGAINTPKLLMLSGVGPKEHLESLNIKVISDLPVGENLQDHLSNIGLIYTSKKTFNLDEGAMWEEYMNTASGPLKDFWASFSFVNSSLAEDPEWPDLEHHVLTPWLNNRTKHTLRKFWNIDPELFDELVKGEENKHIFHFFLTLLRPKSRGYVKLRSNNPQVSPIVDPKYLSHPNDLKVMVESVGIVEKVMKNVHKRLQRLGQVEMNTEALVVPPCRHLQHDTIKYRECIIRTLTATTFHYSGTARMGKATDPTSVVTPDLKVIGVQNLRVVDGSIMPNVVSGNTMAAIIMIAEKASDLIKSDYSETARTLPELPLRPRFGHVDDLLLSLV